MGCGSGAASPELEPVAAVARAAAKSEDITSLTYRMKGTVPGQGRISGTAAMSVDPMAMSMKMTVDVPTAGADGETEVRLVDDALYINGGAEAAGELDGKTWLKFDMSELKEPGGAGSAGLGAAQAEQNPAAESGFLAGAEDVEKVGTEQVEGVETTHYRGSVTLDGLRDLIEDEDAGTREQREKSLERYESLGVDEMDIDLWVDGEDHAKQFRTRAATGQGGLDLTVTFLSVNEPVKVTAPAAEDTVDLADMMSELNGD